MDNEETKVEALSEPQYLSLDDDATVKEISNVKRRLVVLTALIGTVVLVIIFSSAIADVIMDFQDWVALNPGLGTVVYALVYAMATVMMVPGLILTVGAGIVFSGAFGIAIGILVGVLVVLVGASIGAVGAFLVGRYVARTWVETFVSARPKLKALDGLMQEKGAFVMLLLRLSPLVPFNVFNYVMGVFSVTLKDYAIGLVGIIPGTIAFVAVGVSVEMVGDADVASNPVVLSVTIIGTLLAIAASIYISILARRVLKKDLEPQEPAIEMQSLNESTTNQ